MQQISILKPRENNLRIDSINIPLHSLVLLTGPSGSGKSSLAIDTILQEGQRRCFEALRATFPIGGKSIPRPMVSKISNLPPTFGMKQDVGISFSSRTSIASLLGIHSLLMHLFIEKGCVHCPVSDEPLHCFTPSEVTDHLLSKHSNRACHILLKVSYTPETYTMILTEIQRDGYARIKWNQDICFIEDAPTTCPDAFWIVLDRFKIKPQNISRCTDAVRKGLFSVQESVTVQIRTSEEDVEIDFHRFPYSRTTATRYPLPESNRLVPTSSLGACEECTGKGEAPTICQSCDGTGLGPFSTQLKYAQWSFSDALKASPTQLISWLESIEGEDPRLNEIRLTLSYLTAVSIDLPIYRRLQTLSTGERSRVRLCSVLSQQLGQVLYVLDEPSLGLANHEVQCIIDLLKTLKQQGQSFLIVDHHPLFLTNVDHIFHIGPKAGIHGGQLIYTPIHPPTLTKADVPIKTDLQPLLTTPVPIYQSAIHVIAGPSGSGKTELLKRLHGSLASTLRTPVYLLTDLASVGNKRSCVATISNVWQDIRTLIASTKSAKLHRIPASNFSFNRRGGRCEECVGLGSISQNMPPLPPVEVICPECKGKRFNDSTLKATYRDQNISEILSLSIDDCCKLFEHQPHLARTFQAMQLVGLGYLELGQTSPTLSGGEQRRIQIAKILAPCLKKEHNRENVVLLLDDPTAALHSSDAVLLQRTLINLRSANTTVIVTSNNPQISVLADFQYQMEELSSILS